MTGNVIGDDTSPIVYGTSSVANDPHFYLPLVNGDHLCFSVQGEPNFAFNLINSKYIQLNAQFVLPAEDESNTIANVSTFLGDLGQYCPSLPSKYFVLDGNSKVPCGCTMTSA